MLEHITKNRKDILECGIAEKRIENTTNALEYSMKNIDNLKLIQLTEQNPAANSK